MSLITYFAELYADTTSNIIDTIDNEANTTLISITSARKEQVLLLEPGMLLSMHTGKLPGRLKFERLWEEFQVVKS